MLAPYNAFAAVVISSGNIESTTITIVGSGFGAHGDFGEAETYLPYIFEDCGSNGYLTNKSFTCDGVITSENSRSLEDNRSILHVRDDLNPTNITACDGDELADSTNRNTLKYNVEGKAAIHQYFVSEWVYIPTDFYTRIGDDTSNQIKVNLITPIDDPTARQYFNFYGSDILYTNTEVGELAGNEGTMSEIMPAGTWHRLDIFVSIPNETTSFEDKIIFRDFGNGLNKERINDIYCQLLETDKEDSNEYIGAYGIGSKSPFAYCRNHSYLFQISTLLQQVLFYLQTLGFFSTGK